MDKNIYKLRLFLLDLPRDIKLIISLAVDSLLCIFTVLVAFYLRLGEFPTLKNALDTSMFDPYEESDHVQSYHGDNSAFETF